MKLPFVRLINLLIGLFLYALGIVITIKANIGFAPWEVLHVGLSNTIGLSIGTVSIIVGLVIIVIVKLLGEQLGLGTILNMVLIGIFIDVIMKINLLPTMDTILFGLLMLITGLFTISLGTYFYMKSAFGAGPRDSLMVAVARKTKFPVGLCRSIVELLATLSGWLLGGMVGIGTVVSVIGIGFCIQITFRVLKFDPKAVKHESLRDTFIKICMKGE